MANRNVARDFNPFAIRESRAKKKKEAPRGSKAAEKVMKGKGGPKGPPKPKRREQPKSVPNPVPRPSEMTKKPRNNSVFRGDVGPEGKIAKRQAAEKATKKAEANRTPTPRPASLSTTDQRTAQFKARNALSIETARKRRRNYGD